MAVRNSGWKFNFSITLKSACKPEVWRAQVASLTRPVRAAGRNSAMQADRSVLCAHAAGMAKNKAVQAAAQVRKLNFDFMLARSGKRSAPWRQAAMKDGVLT
jgi:hypothetical protein